MDVGENGAGGGLPEPVLSALGGDGDLGKTKAGLFAGIRVSEELSLA